MSAFTKIKHSKGQTVLTRVDDRANRDSIEHTLTSSEPPRPEFVTALQKLTGWVCEVCEVGWDYAEGMTVSGVSLSAGEYGGVVVTALRKVSGASSPVVLNTPHVPEVATFDGGPELPTFVRNMLSVLEDEANKFWNGERAQTEMFPTTPESAPEAGES